MPRARGACAFACAASVLRTCTQHSSFTHPNCISVRSAFHAACASWRTRVLYLSMLSASASAVTKCAKRERFRVHIPSISGVEQSVTTTEHCVPESASASASASEAVVHAESASGRRVISAATRAKIRRALAGRRKPAEICAKISASLKGRSPWNKGKKLRADIRARMSAARLGKPSWNKGLRMSDTHRAAISAARKRSVHVKSVSDHTRRRLRLARRRPGDAIVVATSRMQHVQSGQFPLIETEDIHEFVSLRRGLREWTDGFRKRNGRRPSLADVRRVAPADVVRRFERYATMRERIRGLAHDVYGAVDERRVPVLGVGEVSSGPVNNNGARMIYLTKRGNRRLASKTEMERVVGEQHAKVLNERDREQLRRMGVSTSKDDMWDSYDTPVRRRVYASGFQVDNSLLAAHELQEGRRRNGQLSANDYRMIGKYRLMECADINRYVELRRELERWSMQFKKRTGRTPALSDVRECASHALYRSFCTYLHLRESMSGLVKEVYRTNMDDVETFQHVTEEGRSILDTLRKSHLRPPLGSAPSINAKVPTSVHTMARSQ